MDLLKYENFWQKLVSLVKETFKIIKTAHLIKDGKFKKFVL